MVQQLRLCTSNAEGMGLTPGGETKTAYDVQCCHKCFCLFVLLLFFNKNLKGKKKRKTQILVLIILFLLVLSLCFLFSFLNCYFKNTFKFFIKKNFPGGSDGKECVCNAGDPGIKDPLE